jgi:hypothetical protein
MLFKFLKDYLQELRIEAAYKDALIEDAKWEARAREQRGHDATRDRIQNAGKALDVAAARERLRSRDPKTP